MRFALGWIPWSALALSSAASALDLTADSGAANECAGAPHLQVAAAAYLQPAPLSQLNEYGGSRYLPSAGNNIGVGVAFAEVSAAAAQFCIGLVYRAEFEGSASKDLLDILHGNYFGQTFEPGRAYNARYDAQTLKAGGVRLRRALNLGEVKGFQISLGAGISFLKAMQGRQENLSGTASASSPSFAVGSATWQRTDSDLNPADFNPFIGPGHPTGLGYSTDLQLKAVSSSGTELDVIVMDAVGRIYWRGTRQSLLVLNNDTILYDANFNREALVTGVDSRINEVERIPAKYRVALSQPVVSQLSALLEDDAVNGYHFASLGVRLGSVHSYAATTFDLRTHAIGLRTHWHWVGIALASNRWQPREATALEASVQASLEW
ncbi:MAG: hypothetical protein WDM77_11325 [Steroidobacteraceae bacterium]